MSEDEACGFPHNSLTVGIRCVEMSINLVQMNRQIESDRKELIFLTDIARWIDVSYGSASFKWARFARRLPLSHPMDEWGFFTFSIPKNMGKHVMAIAMQCIKIKT